MSRISVQTAESQKTGTFDLWLLGAALVLAGLGLVMVFSSSGVMAERLNGNRYYFFHRQGIFALVSLTLMTICAWMPRKVLHGPVYLWLFAIIGLLVLTMVPPFSVKAGGARRWMHLGPISLQPMELAKVVLVMYLAYFFSQKQKLVRSFSVGFLPPVVVTGFLGLILLLQPDFGGAVFLGMLFFLMSLVGGTRLTYLAVSMVFGVGAMGLLIASSPYRFKRWFAFLDPFKDPQNVGYQLVQSFYAFGSGGVTGAGFGAGKQKLFYLPEAHNDFIMAVLGEELGFIGVSIVFVCIGILLWRAFRVALAQDDLRDRFTAYGMGLVLGLGFLLNLAVVLGCVPPKGVAMPFLSYGGSNLLSCFLCVGILLNLSRSART
ncbi:putative lipid II flippase FtsW [Desulfovibrio aerotolerans]|uniref:Probable peptidoglycan glycosyltransferase FtsW n=1 Tax=Solidesulfovibrio aerotolerans TaxID=295255 RepID=A0A7C9MGU1_9BACT|nr:putative lipid II flippase FtsW [Solidesulfovibrio aerotolerans]MYL84510.1 putative lipid II flippase FtsW [Solidesulfovibrio aerotolerans]